MNRREVLGGIATGITGLFMARKALAMEERPPDPHSSTAPSTLAAARPGQRAVKPLPFDPKSLRGLSERLIVSHHDNNYAGALRNLNKIEEELSRVTADTPGFIMSGIKERELTFTNSVILHELYFGNLGGDGKASGPIQRDLASAWGSFARWEEMFRSTGMSLAGGSGWAILDFNFHSGDLRTYWSGNHTQALVSGIPLLVMDMYEHAYHLDYGATAARYVEAFFQNVNWDEVNRRLERARRAASALAT